MVDSGVILIKSAFWTVFAVILLILFCCAGGCLSSSVPAGNQSSGPNIIDKTPRDEPVKVTFESAWQDLPYYESTGTVNLTSLTIHQIHGTGVDAKGYADNWIIGVQQRENSSLLIYDRESWRQIAWGEPFTSPVITFDQMILPTQIYGVNNQSIEEMMNSNGVQESEIDLSDGVYTVSIRTSTGLSQLRYNASTGELLSQIG